MNKRICFILALAILMASIGTLSALAEGDSPMPSIYAENKTVTAGNTFEIEVRASDLNAVGALDLYAFYDPEIFTLVSATALSMASGAQTIINTDIAGEASFSMISATGISGAGSLWRIRFRVNQSAVAGIYQVTLAAGDAYNTTLNPVDVSVSSPRITVNSAVQEQKHLYFYPYGSSSTLYNGDTVTVNFATNDLYGLASADFELEYDETLLRFENVALGDKLTTAKNAIYSINSNTPGYIKLSYIAAEGITGSSYPMLSVTFTVISSEAASTQVELKASSVYDESLNIMIGSSAQYTLTIAEVIETPKLPEITVGGFEGTQDTFSVSVQAPGSSALAAVDLMFSFNPLQIICTDVSSTAAGCFVISNIDNENGTIKLSFICEDGIDVDTEIAKIEFSTRDLLGGSVKLNVSGKNAVNSNFETLVFTYKSPTFICHKLSEDATCITPQVCTICGKEFVSSLGHDQIYHEAKAPTCIEFGWGAYYTCSRCDWSTYDQIDALGHTPVTDSYLEPTCTEAGLTEGSHCGVCQEVLVSQETIPALGHRVLLDGKTWVDSITFENDARYPFVFENGVYSSTNKLDYTDSYFTITALYNCVLNISYSVSSEQNYDKIIVRRNGSIIVEISGQVDWNSKEIELKANDIITINYHKDGSTAHYEDTGRFSFNCEKTQISTLIPGLADEAEPTCTESVICHYCKLVVKEALGHNEIVYEAKEPTCTDIGWYDYVACSRCQHSTYVEIDALGHSIVTDVAVEPTCTEAGLTEGSHCETCQTVFKAQEVIDALGHKVIIREDLLVDSIEISNDTIYPFVLVDGIYQSSNQGVSKGVSRFTINALYDCQFVMHVAVSSEYNYDKLVISLNGTNIGIYSGEVSWFTTTLSLKKNDVLTFKYQKDGSVNSYRDTAYFYFSCSQTQITNQTIVPADELDPTCAEDVVCSFCDVVVKTALGHSFGGWYEIQTPTCTEMGTDERECSVCHTKETRTTDALGHTDAIPVVENQVDATCTTDGSYDSVTYCSVCQVETGRDANTIAKLGHDEILHNGKSATCTEDGWNEYVTCTRCDYNTFEKIGALGHNEIQHIGKEPTCTDFGWEEYVTCSRCDYSTYQELSLIGHKVSDWIIDEEATYEKDGRKHKECIVCREILEESIVPMLSHTYTSIVTPPTCTEQGYTTHTCGGCGNTYVDDYTAALGHSWSNWYETKAPTCTIAGTDERECSVCHTKETKTTDALGHAGAIPVAENSVDATCTTDGSYDSVIYCSICGDELSREAQTINKLGHDYSIEWTIDTAPTCITVGSKSHHCSRCDDKADVTEVPANGHVYGDWYETEAPTCTATGTEERECSVCYTKETRTTDALGHAGTIPVAENSVDATCTTDGSYDSVIYCSICGIELSRGEKVIDKLGHDYSAEWTIDSIPTCTTVGSMSHHCTRCNAKTSAIEIPANGHSFANWKQMKAPTCTEAGIERRVCVNCDHFEERQINALGHNDISVVISPTCTEQGYTTHRCSRCNEGNYVDSYVDALGHSFTNYVSNNDATYTEDGTKTSKCDRCDEMDTIIDVGSALGMAQKFRDEMAELNTSGNAENTYMELYAVLQTYSTLSGKEKAEVAKEFATLQQMINAYNAKAETANNELAEATELAFAPIAVTSFAFLAALWFVLRKKFLV